MDNSGSERSPSYTDSSPGSFGQMKFWENDITTATRECHKQTFPLFGIGHVKEIEGLVEDKDVASKAVAFVVNGTRRGVVRLCADVACLMRVRKRLEKTVEKQRRELEHLRSLLNVRASTRTSRSTSPTLPSLDLNQSHISNEKSVCSQCSPASSYSSLRPPSESLEQSTTSFQSKDDEYQIRTSNKNLYDHQQLIRAEVHPIPDNEMNNQEHALDSVEIESQDTLNPKSRESDYDEDEDSDPVTLVEHNPQHVEPLRADCRLQSKLESDLESAKQEIERLRLQLNSKPKVSNAKEKELSHEMSYKTEDEIGCELACEMACEMNVIDETRKSLSSASSLVSLPEIKSSSQSNLALVTQTNSNLHHPCNCHCRKCIDNQKEKYPNHTETVELDHDSSRKGHSNPVQLNDRVVIRGGRIGYIRYIGPLNHGNSDTKSTVYLGLQLEEPHGHHDGIHNGKRYFWCHRNHGVFILVQDVLSVLKSKHSRPQTVRSNSQKISDGNIKQQAVNKRERSGKGNRVGPAKLLPKPPTSAKPKKEFLAGT